GGFGGSPINGYGGPGGDGQGGAIYNGGTLSTTNCTISGNSALAGPHGIGQYGNGTLGSGQGGAIFQTGTGSNSIRNDLITGNTATTSGLDLLGEFISEGYNLVGEVDGSSHFSNGQNHDLVGT